MLNFPGFDVYYSDWTNKWHVHWKSSTWAYCQVINMREMHLPTICEDVCSWKSLFQHLFPKCHLQDLINLTIEKKMEDFHCVPNRSYVATALNTNFLRVWNKKKLLRTCFDLIVICQNILGTVTVTLEGLGSFEVCFTSQTIVKPYYS